MTDSPVLVVAADDTLRDTLQSALDFLGYGVTTARTAEEGLRLARRRPPRAILLDVWRSGPEAVASLKSAGATRDVPLLALADLPSDPRSRGPVASPADEVIVKPFDLDELEASLARWLAPAASAS